MKERIAKINETAYVNMDKAQGMLDMFNDIYGVKFGFLNKRVVIFNDPDASACNKYAHARDAYYNV